MIDKYILVDGVPRPCEDLLEWGRWMEKREGILKQDHIGDVKVSTVFLGLDHGFGDGPPVLWETMIFGGPHDQYQERYSTKEEAERGHQAALALVSAPGPEPCR